MYKIAKPYSLSPDSLVFSFLVAFYILIYYANAWPTMIPGDLRFRVLLTMAIGGYWLFDLMPTRTVFSKRLSQIGKYMMVVFVIGVIVILPTVRTIDERRQSAPNFFVQDGLVQSEAATGFVLAGKDPYGADYRNTPMGQWQFQIGELTVNPALDHYAYMPLTFLLPLPVQVLVGNTWTWFDHRVVYLLFFVAVLVLSMLLVDESSKRLMLLMLISLNPLFVPFFIEGRNDVLTLFWWLLTLVLLKRGRLVGSAIALGLACATKQLAWFFVPFYLVYIAGSGTFAQRVARLKRPLLFLIGAFMIVVLPWFLSNPTAFLTDITYFQSGPSAAGFPIDGVSIGILLMSAGLIKSNSDPFPFWILQIVVGLPLLVAMLLRQWRQPDLGFAMIGYGVILFVTAFLSSFFHENYLGYIFSIMAVALLSQPVGLSASE